MKTIASAAPLYGKKRVVQESPVGKPISSKEGDGVVPLVSKQDMTEEEIKLNYITPAITARWEATCIRMEFKVRDGRIIVDGKTAKRDNPSYADYT